jgi:hypothetical protein
VNNAWVISGPRPGSTDLAQLSKCPGWPMSVARGWHRATGEAVGLTD